MEAGITLLALILHMADVIRIPSTFLPGEMGPAYLLFKC